MTIYACHAFCSATITEQNATRIGLPRCLGSLYCCTIKNYGVLSQNNKAILLSQHIRMNIATPSKICLGLILTGCSLFFQACEISVSPSGSSDKAEKEPVTVEPSDQSTSPGGQGQKTPPPGRPNPPAASPPRTREVVYVAEAITPQPAALFSRSSNSKINVRAQPTTQSKMKHFGYKDDSITLLKKATGEGNLLWYFVRFDRSKAEGWVRADFVETNPSTPSTPNPPNKPVSSGSPNASVWSNTPGLKNVRSGAGTTFPVVTQLAIGDRVEVISEQRDSGGFLWYEICFDNCKGVGWIASQIVEKDP